MCDYKGRIINDIFNFAPSYRIEPLYACIFPLGSGTRVFVFSRNDGFARYARFYRWLKSLSRRKCLDVLLKLIIAYTEEEYFCPDLPDSKFKNPGFKKLACTSNLNLLLDPDLTSLTTKGIVSEFSISNFPDIPELLSRNYSVETLRAIDSWFIWAGDIFSRIRHWTCIQFPVQRQRYRHSGKQCSDAVVPHPLRHHPAPPFTDWQNDLHLIIVTAQGHFLCLWLDLAKLTSAATR